MNKYKPYLIFRPMKSFLFTKLQCVGMSVLIFGAGGHVMAQHQLQLPDSIPLMITDSLMLKDVLQIGYAKSDFLTVAGSVGLVSEERMNKGLVSNPLNALSGQVAGVSVLPGREAILNSVRVRGTTSLTGGNDPLVIIDDVFADLGTLSMIYPADIESFTILKDASETAQYGARGASGVIKVSTKQGSSGSFRFSYDGNYGVQAIYKTLDMLSGDAFRQVARERGISILDKGYQTDFTDEITRMGWIQNHHIAFGGGSESAYYRASLGLLDQEDVLRTSDYRNYMAKIDITQHAFQRRLRFDVGVMGSVSKNQNPVDLQKTFYSAAAFNPTFPNHKNKEGGWDQVTTASWITNPLAWIETDDEEANAYFNAHIKAEWAITPYLKLQAFGSYLYNVIDRGQYLPTTVWAHGQAYRAERKVEDYVGNILLNYNRAFNAHKVDLVGLAEVQQREISGFYTTVTNFTTDKYSYHNLQAGASRPWEGTGSYYENPRLASFLGRFNYVYADRYVLNVNARMDASSKVGANHRWGFFPSISGAWNVCQEDFMKGVKWISNLKLRMGYGLSGNQDAIDSYSSLQSVMPNGIVLSGSDPMVTMGIIRNANPDLKWEIKRTFNEGVDAAFWGGRAIMTFDYYRAITDDMLYQYDVSVPPFAYNKLLANLGSMRNSGVELGFGFTPIRKKDMELNVNVNVTFQKNKLLSLSGMYNGEYMSAPLYTPIADVTGAGLHGGYNHIVYQIVGQPLGVFYLPHCTGLVQREDGTYAYEIADLGGGGINLEDGGDRYIAGQATPKTLLGSNISFRYKEFDISLQINGAFGHKIYNGTSLSYMNMGSLPDYNVLSAAPARNIYDQTATDYWLEDGDYINFDYLTIGWNVPLKRFGQYVRRLRLSFSVNNLATISGYSGLTPMINSYIVNSTLGVDDKRTCPVYRSYSLGLSIQF